MSNGLLTLDDAGKIVTCNSAGLRILLAKSEQVLQRPAGEFFTGSNAWILEKLKAVEETGEAQISMDAPLQTGEERRSVNLTVQSLFNAEQKRIGAMMMMEDISKEKTPQVGDVGAHGPDDRRPAGGGRCRRAGRAERGMHRPVLRHPRLHHAYRATRRARHGFPAQRILHADGRLHPGRGRDAGQIHRRRHHGGVRHSADPRRRRRPCHALLAGDDQHAQQVERQARRRGQAAGQHRRRPQYRGGAVGQHRFGKNARITR